MGSKLILAALVCGALYGQGLQPAIDNEHVTVWDQPGVRTQTHAAHDHDAVVMTLSGPRAGTAVFVPKGERFKSGAARSVVIELKDAPATHYENTTGYPPAFPRPHVKKLFENKRVVVWSYRWNPGEPTPMHFHDKDVVVVYLEDTAVVSTTPDGAKKLNQYKAFDIRFNKGDRTHTELLDHGTGSAMMMELK
jgi:hypothetical protein